MASKTAASKQTAKQGSAQEQRRAAAGRTHVTLPDAVASEGNVSWPGSARGGSSRNSALRAQLAADVQTMSLGSVRKYVITGDKEQEALISLMRKVADEVHGPIFGVQAVKQTDAVFVRLGNRRQVKPKSQG